MEWPNTGPEAQLCWRILSITTNFLCTKHSKLALFSHFNPYIYIYNSLVFMGVCKCHCLVSKSKHISKIFWPWWVFFCNFQFDRSFQFLLTSTFHIVSGICLLDTLKILWQVSFLLTMPNIFRRSEKAYQFLFQIRKVCHEYSWLNWYHVREKSLSNDAAKSKL